MGKKKEHDTLFDAAIKSLESASANVQVALCYPVYVNTYVLADILNKHAKGIKTFFFTWSDIIPSNIESLLKDEKFDIIYCFSSSDKEDFFRSRVSKIIFDNKLEYKVTVSQGDPGKALSFKHDIPYSNFSLKYLFLEDKINIHWIHEFCCHFFECQNRPPEINPYINKLSSLLLSRGYETIELDTDIQDESKGLLRKLLYEEYKFKFRITPKQSSDKANSTLRIASKGGQQSYEEIKRQNMNESNPAKSYLKTFVVPDKIKYTSKTKLIGIYKTGISADRLADLNYTAKALKDISDLIFESDALEDESFYKKMFNDLEDYFVFKNISYIVDKLRNGEAEHSIDHRYDELRLSNSFLKSFEHYQINESVIRNEFKRIVNSNEDESEYANSKLIKMIRRNMAYLQLKGYKEFKECLEDHHVTEKEDSFQQHEPSSLNKKELINTYHSFCREVLKVYPGIQDDKNGNTNKIRSVFLDGFFLIKLILEYPNGFPEKKISDSVEEFIKSIEQDRKSFETLIKDSKIILDKTEIFKYYNLLKILAEDLNFLIAEEALLCDPKIILSVLKNFDISEFEYLYSIGLAEYYRTSPSLKS